VLSSTSKPLERVHSGHLSESVVRFKFTMTKKKQKKRF